MGIKEDNKRITITISKQDLHAIKILSKTLNMHYTHLISNVIKQYVEMFKLVK